MSLDQIALQNEERLRKNEYPGRGLVIGMTRDGKNLVQIYWIMGRSTNSQNRVFEAEGNFVKTKAFDEAKMEDPSLIIYYPVKVTNDCHIVTNGDQTDTIYDAIKAGQTFGDALDTRTFEPDAPHFTPRISGFIDCRETPAYGISVLKSVDNNKEFCQRNYFYYQSFISGFGHCVHTYGGNGNPLPSFSGEPVVVKLFDNIDQNAEFYWNLLNEKYRVSLLVKYIGTTDQKVTIRIVNKNV